MSVVDEFRSRGIAPPPKDNWARTLALGVVVAFGLGAGGALAWRHWAAPGPALVPTPKAAARAVIPPSGERLGSARAAPLLGTCLRQAFALSRHGSFGSPFADVDPATIYDVMTQFRSALRMASLVSREGVSRHDIAMPLAPIIDCIYSRDTALCEPNNRALAVDVVGDLIAHGARLDAEAASLPPLERHRVVNREDYVAVARVKRALAHHANQGHLIAADFGWFAHPDIKRIFEDNPATRNGCDRA
jgi:hypothetical protein